MHDIAIIVLTGMVCVTILLLYNMEGKK